ncbi:low-density lipoprotein receptor-like isoform X3 [Pomacea canaliculata]|uniref:low-density lipoprotein receptor-like isoform X3 n=1 Tax=Pomacea canaliculata TaxID=400727 RepID=UPI000D72C5AA|nr:low-density lipoprotein receptor-like isoform X3 [Pomacea canaliculata]
MAYGVLTATAAVHDYRTKVKRELRRQARICGENQFLCTSGECILSEWTCDTQADCADGSDEQECECRCRGENRYQCHNGKCVPAAFVCDVDDDCGDNSDEIDCHYVTCRPEQVQCDNFKCINPWDLCDGVDDCRNGWDERDCATCREEYILCGTGTRCIPATWRCDGWPDCADGSDEHGVCVTPPLTSCVTTASASAWTSGVTMATIARTRLMKWTVLLCTQACATTE